MRTKILHFGFLNTTDERGKGPAGITLAGQITLLRQMPLEPSCFSHFLTEDCGLWELRQRSTELKREPQRQWGVTLIPPLAGGCADLPHGMFLQLPKGSVAALPKEPAARSLLCGPAGSGRCGGTFPGLQLSTAQSAQSRGTLLGLPVPLSPTRERSLRAAGKCKILCGGKEREEFTSPNSPNLVITLLCLHFV